MRLLFTAAIFVGSFLLFLVQPMAARIMLPAFGGTPAVWTASMVFFQAALLGGYAYAHGAARKIGPRNHAVLHIILLGLAGLTLPFAIRTSGGAQGQAFPALALMGQLAILVGATFFLVSAGAPTVQRWFASTKDKDAKDPYFLYSASNVGSMAALIAYPFYFEPRFDLTEQVRIWAAGYALLVVLLIGTAIVLWRQAPEVESVEAKEESPAPTWAQRRLWMALSAVPSSLLLGVTGYLSSNIAPIPLLWVVPLSLYLITFILAFSNRVKVPSSWLGRILPLIVTPLAIAIILESAEPLFPLAAVHLVAFFLAAWMCHARLSELRPDARHLTEFFLWVSVGGMLGGIFNALLAPVVFKTLLEYPIALVLACLLRPSGHLKEDQRKFAGIDFGYALGIGAFTLASAAIAAKMGMTPSPMRTGIVIGIPLVLAFFAVDRPIRFGLMMGSLFLVTSSLNFASAGEVLLTDRSFFGVHRVEVMGKDGNFRRLFHGNTFHGIQDRNHPEVPLTYYYPTGPIGRVFRKLPAERTQNVALVGLGIGSLAAYGRAGQHMTYFEIDPVVEKIARDARYFTFLRDTKAKLDVVLGDARLTLASTPDNGYGLIVLDAFSSDAIPVHLLTREAFASYLRKLKPNGVIAVHISNRYLELEPVLATAARDLDLVGYSTLDAPRQEETDAGKLPSNWVILARHEEDLGPIVDKDADWDHLTLPEHFRPWTDEFSNVLDVFDPSH